MIDRQTQVTLVAIALAIALWYASLGFTDSTAVQVAILVVVGLGVPGLYRLVRGGVST